MRFSRRYFEHLVLYILNPFIAFILSLRYYNQYWFKNFLWIFIVFYGFSFSFTEGMDASHYKNLFEAASQKFEYFSSIIDVFDPVKTRQLDFARPLINFVLSGFTKNYHVLFAVYGLIFGFFYSRNISFLIENCNLNGKKIKGWLLFAAFFVGAWQINGFRFWTATHIFLYGLIAMLVNGNRKRGLTFMLLSAAFHYSFLLPLLIFAGYKLVPKLQKSYLLILFALIFFNPIDNLDLVRGYLQKFKLEENQVLNRKIDTYTSVEAEEGFDNREVVFGSIRAIAGKTNQILILILAWSSVRHLKLNRYRKYRELYNFGLILALSGAILSFIPSVGRFYVVGTFCLLLIAVIINSHEDVAYTKSGLFRGLGYVAIFNLFVSSYWILFTFSLHLFAGNYLSVLFDQQEVLYSVGDFFIDIL